MKCICGKTVTEDEVWYSNKEDEYGECSYEIGHDCDECGATHEEYGWGEIEGAKDILEHYDFYNMEEE